MSSLLQRAAKLCPYTFHSPNLSNLNTSLFHGALVRRLLRLERSATDCVSPQSEEFPSLANPIDTIKPTWESPSTPSPTATLVSNIHRGSNLGKLHAYDSQIDRTFHRLIRSPRSSKVVNNSSHKSSVFAFDFGILMSNSANFGFNSANSDSNFGLDTSQFSLDNMGYNNRTLKELATLDVLCQLWCIRYPELEQAKSYELESGLIHLFPKFHGLAGEDPHKHLKEFHVVCSTMRPHGILEDYTKMREFPFSLDGAAKDWLYLQPALFNTQGDMKRMFLEKFFPTSITTSTRKEICDIRQHSGETLYKYWERFNKLCATCPHYQIRIMLMERSMIDIVSGGALMDKVPTAARNLISNMAGNTQQFGIRGFATFRVVHEVVITNNQRLENKITKLTSLVRQLAIEQHHTSPLARVCSICASIEHPIDICPILQETEPNTTKIAAMMSG
ncbi:hypothetical protein CR513_31827, partial [Mucuna pruriens]